MNSQIFGSILTDHGFAQHVDRPTHEKGGVLDAVAIRSSSLAPFIETINTGFSDHFLLRWASTMMRPPPVYKTSLRRCWRIFNLDAFLEQLRTSSLVCDAVNDLNVAVDEYNTELSAILDRQLPLKLTRSRARRRTRGSMMTFARLRKKHDVLKELQLGRLDLMTSPGGKGSTVIIESCSDKSVKVSGRQSLNPNVILAAICGFH